jgi:hypothetical protein
MAENSNNEDDGAYDEKPENEKPGTKMLSLNSYRPSAQFALPPDPDSTESRKRETSTFRATDPAVPPPSAPIEGERPTTENKSNEGEQ